MPILRNRKPQGARWLRFKLLVLATYSDRCHLCGHGGAGEVDHLIPTCERPDLAWALTNCRMAHGRDSKCQQCGKAAGKSGGVACNQLRGGRSIAYAKRVLQGNSPPRPEPGRDW